MHNKVQFSKTKYYLRQQAGFQIYSLKKKEILLTKQIVEKETFFLSRFEQTPVTTTTKNSRSQAVCYNRVLLYSQTCVQQPPLGPEKRGRYAEGCMIKISGKWASCWPLWLYGFRLAVVDRWPLFRGGC
jgi:hypothetical protein